MKNKLSTTVKTRIATLDDITRLLEIENACFKQDRLTQRSLKHFLTSPTATLLLVETAQGIMGYGLVLCHHATSLARVYSLAIHPKAANQGLGNLLLDQMEEIALAADKLFIRLEVAENNAIALHVYTKRGYTTTALVPDYYEDGTDAIRMEKKLQRKVTRPKRCPYVPQSTEFTCGPAALLMAMKYLDKNTRATTAAELNIWREATTIFMASGHGGTSPLGLAIAAHNRNFGAELWMYGEKVPFIRSMRTAAKRAIYEEVHKEFERQFKEKQIPLKNRPPSIENLERIYEEGATAIVLTSTYQLDREKTPHWIWVVKIDSHYVYINDPYVEDDHHTVTDDSIFIPVPRPIFQKMMRFGTKKLSAAVILRPH